MTIFDLKVLAGCSPAGDFFPRLIWFIIEVLHNPGPGLIYNQGRHSNQSQVAQVVFLPHPESQHIFWAPRNKNFQIPEVALVDFTPNWRQYL